MERKHTRRARGPDTVAPIDRLCSPPCPADTAVTDPLLIDAALPPTDCAALLARLRNAAGEAAGVTSDGPYARVAPRVRAATLLQADDASRAVVAALLDRTRPALEAHFGLTLARHEPPQFLRYGVGGFFVAHQDGNTPLIHDDTRHRRISLVLFLNAPADDGAAGYGGGEFVLHPPAFGTGQARAYAPAPGALLAFRAETTHEVLPVAHGVRYTVVSWWR